MANRIKLGESEFGVGDEVKVRLKTQVFSGRVLAIRGRGDNRTFTVRRIAAGGIGVERIFPVISPWITKVEVKKRIPVRQAKLYYLRHHPSP